MFKFLFIKKHKKKIIDYLDSVWIPNRKSFDDGVRFALSWDKSEETKHSREVDANRKVGEDIKPKYSIKIETGSLPSGSDIKYSDRGPASDSFDPQRIADAMRSHLQETTSTVSLMSSANISFVNKVEQHIQSKGLESAEVYKAAHMDRRLFSKMICNRDYQPSKDTVLSLIFSLKLNLDEAKDLLERAGYSLSHSIRRDIIIEYFIKEGVYNLNNINAFLYNMNEKIIGKG